MLIENINSVIAGELKVRRAQVDAAVQLLDDGNTVPFIARYRKEATGELEDEQLRTIEERLTYLRNFVKRQEEIIAKIHEQGKLTDELRAEILKGIPLNRLGDAEDVARSCLFLASELSSYITGATLDVNGGMLIH